MKRVYAFLLCAMLAVSGMAIAEEGADMDLGELAGFDWEGLMALLGTTYPDLPDNPELGQWYTAAPEGAVNSDGTPWHGLVRLGSENKAMVFFNGGGISVTGETSRKDNDNWFFLPNNSLQDILVSGGIFLQSEQNPFSDWTILVLQYGTGDFHCGTGEYRYTDENGEEQVTYHHGYTNYSLFMDMVRPYAGDPEALVVTGSSAGGFATALLADDVIERFPSAENVTVCVDSALLYYDGWQETARNLWRAPEEFCERLTGSNITLDSLKALQAKRGDAVKILFTCSTRDHDLQRYQAYLNGGEMEANPLNSDLFQLGLAAFVLEAGSELHSFASYIWEYGNMPDTSTQHMIWVNNPLDELSGGISPINWLYNAVSGEMASYGLELLEVKADDAKTAQSILPENYDQLYQTDAPLEDQYTRMGAYAVTGKVVPVENPAIRNIRIWYPAEMSENDHLYPMIVVVNASNTPASVYLQYFERLASWGFIVVGNDDPQTGTGDTASFTLDYMLNESDLRGRIDKENLGLVGYSQGGAGALAALTTHENGSLYKTVFTGSAAYPALGLMMGWEYDPEKITIPYFMTAATGTSDDMGLEDINAGYAGVAPLASLVQIYEAMPDDVLKVRARAVGAEHEEMLQRTDGYMTAWMLYHLQGDEAAGAALIGEDAEILSNPLWQDVEKNR